MTVERRLVVGTAGHIDHGKTALVGALTGVDTDRLPEEKARGITIDLGFAELPPVEGLQTGVVDVPGHEDFIRAMVAGATGVDAVLLVVAADEGVMPQTVEHLDIVRLLGVPQVVVALTKVDLVDEEWLGLVEGEVRELLADTPYGEAPIVATSTADGTGLGNVLEALQAAAVHTRPRDPEDVVRLPVDRVFSLQGTGTVVTGTLWSGQIHKGDRLVALPGGQEARVRALQVHGREVEEARAGQRTAVALGGVDRGALDRGQTLVRSGAWESTWMLTALVDVLPRSPWGLAQGQRVRVHVGTVEVLARCAVLGPDLLPGEQGWVQFRLEEPVVARAGDRLVLRSYSPVTTVGGGVVAEPVPPKRKRLGATEVGALEALVSGDPTEAFDAVLFLAGWEGVSLEQVPMRVGVRPWDIEGLARKLEERGGLVARSIAFAPEVAREGARRVMDALGAGHVEAPLRPVVSLDRLRAALPSWAPAPLADAIISALAGADRIELAEGGARTPGFVPRPTPDQAVACRALQELYRDGGLAPPFLDELPAELRVRADLRELIRYLEGGGALRSVDDGLWFDGGVLDRAASAVAEGLGGRTGLGPADFRDVLPVSRRHLMPLLAWLDGLGVTVRRGPVRDVPARN